MKKLIQVIPNLEEYYVNDMQELVLSYLTEQGYNPELLEFKLYKIKGDVDINPLNSYTKRTLIDLNISYNEKN